MSWFSFLMGGFLLVSNVATGDFYVHQDFDVHVLNDSALQQKYYETYRTVLSQGGHGTGIKDALNTGVDGFNYMDNKGDVHIYVRYGWEKDKDGNRLPDFCALGHEVYHLPEMGGEWHN